MKKKSWPGAAVAFGLVLAALVLCPPGVMFSQEDLPSAPAAAPDPAGPGPAAPADGSTVQVSIPLPPIAISVEIDKPRLPRDDTLSMTVSLTWESPAAWLAFPIDFEFPEPPRAPGLTLYASGSRTVTELAGDTVKVAASYTFKFIADQVMETEVGPITVLCSRPGSPDQLTLSAPALPVTVTQPAFNLFRLIGRSGLQLILVLVMLAAAAGLVYPRLKERRRSRFAPAEPERPPLEASRERLREVDRLRMAGDYQGYFRALDHELARGLSEFAGLKVRGRPAEKAAEDLAREFGEQWRERYLEFEKTADRVKFAGHEPEPAELDRAMQTARELIERAHEKLRAERGREAEAN